MTIFAQNMNTLWRASGLTQKEFAELFGANQKSMWTYIAGKSEPNGFMLVRICEHYSIDLNFLLNTVIKVKNSDIINRPSKGKEIISLKKRADELIRGQVESTKVFAKEIGEVLVKLERVSRLK